MVVAFVAALGLLAAAALIDWRQINRMDETATSVARAHEVQANLNRLLSLAQDVETGERGFVVTGDPAFLEPFETGLNGMVEQQRRLGQVILFDEQKANLRVLESLIAQRIAVARRDVELRRSAGFEAARQAVASGEGKTAMDAVRAQLTRMDVTQQTLLEQRSAAARREANKAVMLSTSVFGVSAALFIAVFALVLRENLLRQRAQVQLDRLFTLSLDMLCIAGTDGYFKRLSPAFNQTLGYTTDELLARPFLDFVHPDDRAATLAEVEKLSHGVPTVDFENRYQCKDGSWKWVSWRTQPVIEEGLLYATARDTTERKRAQEQILELNAELQQRAKELEEANKELESFSYSISHDLRAPLRHVHGYVEMLQRATDGHLSGQAQRYLKTITEVTVEMAQLIDDLLALSRTARAEIRESRVNLDDLVRETIRGLEMATWAATSFGRQRRCRRSMAIRPYSSRFWRTWSATPSNTAACMTRRKSRSAALAKRTGASSCSFATTAPGSTCGMSTNSSASSSGCTEPRSSKAPESAWPPCGGSWRGTAVASGPKARSTRARPFISR